MPATCRTPWRTRWSTTISAPVRRAGRARGGRSPRLHRLQCNRLRNGRGSVPRSPTSRAREERADVHGYAVRRDPSTARRHARSGARSPSTPTDIWNDSCAVDELEYAISLRGGRRDRQPDDRRRRLEGRPGPLARARPGARRGAARRDRGRPRLGRRRGDVARAARCSCGRPSRRPAAARAGSRCRPTRRSTARPSRMLAQGRHFDTLAPNIIVKFPATSVGHRGDGGGDVPRASASTPRSRSASPRRSPRPRPSSAGCGVARPTGLPIDAMGPVITLMMGRLEDWLRVLAERDGIVADPAALPGPGSRSSSGRTASSGERGFRARLLGAAIRHHLHWSELDRRRRRDHDAVGLAAAVQRLRRSRSGRASTTRSTRRSSPSSRRGSPTSCAPTSPTGCAPAEFDTFGPTVRTLRAFIGSYHELLHQVTDAMLPNPDVRRRDASRRRGPRDRAAERPARRAAARPAGRAMGRSGSTRRRPAGGTCPSRPRPSRRRSRGSIGAPDHETAIVNLSGGDLVVDLGDGERGRPRRARHRLRPAAVGVLCSRRRHRRGHRDRSVPRGPGRRSPIASAPTRRGGLGELAAGLGSGRRTSGSRSAAPAARRARSATSSRRSSRPTGCCSSRSSRRPATGRAGRRTSTTSTTCRPRRSSRRSITTGSDGRRRGRSSGSIARPSSPLGAARDGVWAVRDGEVVLVTDGYHPFVATDADDA